MEAKGRKQGGEELVMMFSSVHSVCEILNGPDAPARALREQNFL